jgi:iron complex transport system substrate-binding protein
MGDDPRSFGGRNLVRELRSKITSSGRIGPFANSTYWGVLALRAARSTVPKRSISYIRGAALASGGFGYAVGSGADSNDTAAAVMALRAGRVPCNWRVMTKAYAYMHTLQDADHGYELTPSAGSDSQSTSWVVQARIKCGLSNTRALEYLAARHRTNGSYAYSASSTQTPAWVTAQVLPAVHGRAYPIR